MTAAGDGANGVREFRPVGDQRFRILSLDGGGIRGTFTASFLAALEEHTGKRLVEHFDLIAGTSTGGIIALALGLDIPAKEVRDRYVEMGDQVFPATGARLRGLRHWFRTRRSSAKLRGLLDDVFDDRQLGEASTRLVIPSFNAVQGEIHLFKTAHHPRFTRDYKERARDVGLATSAAPTYFSVFSTDDGNRFVDGGVWANNPVAVAVNEAVGTLGCEPTSVEVLSVGTTSEPFHVPGEKDHAGIIGWLRGLTIVRLVAAAQDSGALGLALAVTGHDRLERVDPTIIPGRFPLDDSTSIEELRALGEQAARHAQPKIQRRFLDTSAPTFQPYHQP